MLRSSLSLAASMRRSNFLASHPRSNILSLHSLSATDAASVITTQTTATRHSPLCKKLAVLGGGQMAEAMLSSLCNRAAHGGTSGGAVDSAKYIHVYDTHRGRLDYLSKTYGVSTCADADSCVKNADFILLAVKPQNVRDLAASISTPCTGLLLSIVAGCTLSQLKQDFKTDKVMRTMPNTPAMVGEGITVWIASKETPREEIDVGKALLDSIGEQVEVHDEKYLDMATAISGSGPAYIFLTMEAMIDAGVHMGFPREIATKLVLATMKGSACYAQETNKASIPNLKNNVTSPAGTTASALYELEKGGFRTVVADAIWAAYRKALELGGNDSNVGPGRNKF